MTCKLHRPQRNRIHSINHSVISV